MVVYQELCKDGSMVAFPKGKHLEGHYALLKGGWESIIHLLNPSVSMRYSWSEKSAKPCCF
jgi:hypothetical protein